MLYLSIFLSTALYAAESFITPQEYAKQLYHNPRGIGCHKCHGELGGGKVIARYVHKGEERIYAAPAIDSIPFEQFKSAFDKRTIGMPRYFLTDEEIEMLYLYLHPKTSDAQ